MGLNSAFTWRGQASPTPSDAECVELCVANAEEAARLEGRARERSALLKPGDPGFGEARVAITRYVREQEAWRQHADWYRAQVAAAAAAPKPAAGPPSATAAPPPTREPGEDDDDDERLSAWQDLGAAVQR